MRVYAELDDQTLREVTDKAEESGISKGRVLLKAIDVANKFRSAAVVTGGFRKPI